jgi:hypothetical protein
MSVPTKEQTEKFLAPLRARLTVVLLHEADAKLPVGQFLLRCAGLNSLKTTILDTDAFYSTTIGRFEQSGSIPEGEILLLPQGGFEVSHLLPLLSSNREMLIIDDLNSLYSLASDSRRSQQLTILLRLLSHNAKMNRSWTIATFYGTDIERRKQANQRSPAAVGDLVLDTDFHADSIRFKASRNEMWASGEYCV